MMANESVLRFAFFISSFLFFATLEYAFARRKQVLPRIKRWGTNFGMVALSSFVVRVSGLMLPVSLASLCQKNHWGFFYLLELNDSLRFILTLVIFDCVIYWQHRLFHYLPFLWRFHQVHHLDLELDVSSGNRFHPVEIFLSMLIKLSFVFILGAPAIAVLSFEILLNSLAQFNHANLYLPRKLEGLLRRVLVTPDLHIVHHSTNKDEMNRNFGFNLSLWDRLFNSYQAKPNKGCVELDIGLELIRQPSMSYLWRALMLPFLPSKRRRHKQSSR